MNGRNSCSGNSRHIDIRYFFVKDRVESGEIKIKHRNTSEMLANFFTKPLQGNLSRKFRDVIMGYKDISTITEPKDVEGQLIYITHKDKETSQRTKDNEKRSTGCTGKRHIMYVDVLRK